MANYNEVQPNTFKSKSKRKKHGGGKRGGENRRGGNRSGHGGSFNQEGSNRGNKYSAAYEREWNNEDYQNQNHTINSNSFTDVNNSSTENTFAEDDYNPNNVSAQKELTQTQPTNYSSISRRDRRDDATSVHSSHDSQGRSSNSTQRYTNASPRRRSTSGGETNAKQAQPASTKASNDQKSPDTPYLRFIARKLEASKHLPSYLQEAAKAQLAFILTEAARKQLTDRNDWSKQKIPLLDGGGELLLQWEKENGVIGGPNTLNETSSSLSHQVTENHNDSQTANFPTNNALSRQESAKHERFGNRRRESDEEIMVLDAAFPTPVGEDSRRYLNSTQGDITAPRGGITTPQTISHPAINSKRVANEDYASNERKRQRAERFEVTNFSSTPRPIPKNEQNGGPVVGLNTNLEKSYLRLTSEPDPYKVRPQYILEKSVEYVLRKYNSMRGKEALNYLNDQFKSIRQDLTVQHIKNDFAIAVYEQNARLSLKHDDLGEFNQCLGQLKFLYNYKRQSSPEWSKRFISSEVEMICYKIVYMMITNNNSEICKIKLSLLEDYGGFQRNDANVVYFRFISSLFKLNTYKMFNNCFKFYEEISKYEGLEDVRLALKVISSFLDYKVRLSGLYIICGANRTGMKMESLQSMLRFQDRKECEVFLQQLHLDTFVAKGDFQAFKAKGAVKTLYKKSAKIDIKGQI
ncbi:hypothetical protein CORT_0A05650 [Candida orthopsilosis Co 90-125]|uniref:SAC3/GANP/THP3 conserved domain-containing protein n=1 Tax=Candida orthopsilosis (strain 90-125) TaxID=1136231 RepID=H8WY05_CANO9|nr:hypothetical protein CORT_0A05650 [Candida orthopsilosis Co 90-125]CCG20952.1 hypothetical protein CORT_0A05650 [Candida orthopsilosis Co 90-125]